jgi:hypothetical protein
VDGHVSEKIVAKDLDYDSLMNMKSEELQLSLSLESALEGDKVWK